MKRLFHYLRKYPWYYVLAVIAMLTGIGLDMFNPRLLKTIVDEVIIGGKTGILRPILLALLGITLGRAVLGYSKEYLFDFGSQKVVADMRRDLFTHLQTLPFSFFDRINTGELMSRLKDDIDNIWRAIAFGIMLFMEQLIYFTVATILLFTLNWKLALVSLAMMPPIAWLAFKLEKQIGAVWGKISDQGVVINTTAQENLAGVRLVKSFGREKYEIQKFLEQNQENYRLNMEQARIWGKYFPGIELMTNVVIVLVTAVGGWLVMRGEVSIGTLVAFSNYVFMLIWPMRMMGWLTNILAQCRASLKKIEAFFMEEPLICDPPAPRRPERITGHLVFENVGFEVQGNRILTNINFDLKPGKTIAIMGMTGSGKSSIINLIGRYYDCSAGNIYLDGIPVKDWPLKTLREQISVVMQDTFLFSDTIAENIRFGAPEATCEQVEAAIRDAGIDDFIKSLPEGLGTVIGERGLGLSGGQKQRISLARALVKNSKILILDDATSNLDLEKEYEIQKALEQRKDVSKIIIAHRISAVKNADEIIILEKGEIVERGTHRQLLKSQKRYYETYCEQFQGVIEVTPEEEAG
ncbi:MAG: ABC transporter ATP-binding protein/permease [Firmicutes bacterium]|nr:ABC transporter ATP-binding protein/permease [Bacillota bacterium]